MLFLNLIKEIDVSDANELIYNRSLLVVQEARRRGIEIKSLATFGKYPTNFFSVIVNNKKHFFNGLPLLEEGVVSRIDLDDKLVLKRHLKINGFPCARGEVFHNVKPAVHYGVTLGFPLVVKPRAGSLSKHTTVNIVNEKELREAIRVARMISVEFMVEEYVPSNVYRITVVGGRVLACCLREPPNIIGDGIHSISELVKNKNADPRRGDISQRNTTLHKIAFDENTLGFLMKQGVGAATVLSQGKKIYLNHKVILGCGADIHDVTDDLHQESKDMFLRLARSLDASVVGIDFIAEDIMKSYNEQRCAILEANSLPYIDMHHFPVSGKARDIAGAIMDEFLSREA